MRCFGPLSLLFLFHFDGFCKITNGLDIMESDTDMLYHQHKSILRHLFIPSSQWYNIYYIHKHRHLCGLSGFDLAVDMVYYLVLILA